MMARTPIASAGTRASSARVLNAGSRIAGSGLEQSATVAGLIDEAVIHAINGGFTVRGWPSSVGRNQCPSRRASKAVATFRVSNGRLNSTVERLGYSG